MSTPVPPDPNKRDLPEQPDGGAAQTGADQSGAQRASAGQPGEEPTEQLPGSPGAGGAGAAGTSGPGTADASGSPAAGSPGAGTPHTGFAAGAPGPGGPTGPGGPGGPGDPTGPGGPGRRRWRPRRRWPVVLGAVIVGLLLLALAFGAGRVSGRFHERAVAFHDRGDGPGRMFDGHPGRPGMLGERWHDGDDDDDGPPWATQRGDRGNRGERGPRGPVGEAVVGTVASVNGATVVVNVDGGQPVNVTTNERTRVRGEQRHAVGDLKAGDRVVVRSRPGQPAAAVVVTTARTVGTVSALDGDRATITEPDGLTQAVDLSAITAKPVLGDRVAVRGTVADNGTTLKANSVRILPKS